MKRMLLFCLAAVLLFPVSSQAEANYGVYLAPKVMGAIQHSDAKAHGWDMDDYDISDGVFGGALALGYDFHVRYGLPLRLELEYAMTGKSTNTEDGWSAFSGAFTSEAKVRLQTLFANVYLDWQNPTFLTPYLGAGMGLGLVDAEHSGMLFHDNAYIDLDSSSKTEATFAWNVGAGVAANLTGNIAVDAGYRFVGFGDGKTKTTLNGWRMGYEKNYMHQFMVGMRFTF